MEETALFLCDHSGIMAQPWAEAGVQCICVDLMEQDSPRHPNILHVVDDVRTYRPPMADYVFGFAFPPCTHTAVSGARWFRQKGPRAAAESFSILASCLEILEWCGCQFGIENPVSTFSTYWRKPDFTFDPCDFGGYLDPPGDEYTKKTCLWTGGGFVMPEPKRVEPTEGSKMHLLPPSEDRAQLRSLTPRGFARAVFEANCETVRQ